jgi:murein DD-endopeptidase MepM/ murein hydrolase activator NlpD
MKAHLRRIVFVCLTLSCVTLLACGSDSGPTGPAGPKNLDYFAEDSFSFDIDIGSRTTFRIDGINGSVQITGDPSATSVVVGGVRRVESDSEEDAQNRLAGLSVRNTESDTDIQVWTVQPEDTQGRNYKVDYIVTLPQSIEIDAGNANGAVTVQSMKSQVSIDNPNGDVLAENIEGNTLVKVRNGTIVASVTLPLGGDIDLELKNGTIDLTIPQTTSARLSATATSGTVSTSNLNITSPDIAPNSVMGTLGRGHGTITLSVENGSITVNGVGSEHLSYVYPLVNYRVIQEFANPNPFFGLKYHCAEDAYGMPGTPVYAIADGVISYSGPMGGYGWLIIIDHPMDNVYSLYGHVSTRREKTIEGQVSMGERIAYLADDDEDGSGGDYPDWGPHLHFSIRQGVLSDYPSSGDNRWEAGYTTAHPTTLGWMDPTDFIEAHSR